MSHRVSLELVITFISHPQPTSQEACSYSFLYTLVAQYSGMESSHRELITIEGFSHDEAAAFWCQSRGLLCC